MGAPVKTSSAQNNAHIKTKSTPHHSIPILQSANNPKRDLVRSKHARELLGKKYRKSIVKNVLRNLIQSKEKTETFDHILGQWTHRALRGRWKKRSSEITKTIICESDKYGLDPVFLMAVIQSESNFHPTVVGSAGEIGLMQVTLQTAKWITKKYQIPWKGAKSLKDPVINIRIGAAYLSYLREKFDFKSHLYIAAYNMGSGKVLRAAARRALPRKYPMRVLANYVRFYSALDVAIQQKFT